MKLIPETSITPNLSNIERDMVNFMGESAFALNCLLKEKLISGYDKLELIYFVEYIICEMFKLISRGEDRYRRQTDEFRKWHLFNEVIENFGDGAAEMIDDLDNISIKCSNRMNEYYKLYPLSQVFKVGDHNESRGIITSLHHNLYPFDHKGSHFNIDLWTIFMSFLIELQKGQNEYVINVLKKIAPDL